MNFIQRLRESDSTLLKSEATDLEKWSKLRHTKADLELFLTYNIAEIKFLKKDGSFKNIICTSNIALINSYNVAKTKEKKKIIEEGLYRGLRSGKDHLILTYDFLLPGFKSINLDDWTIINFLSITKDNILLLNSILWDLIRR